MIRPNDQRLILVTGATGQQGGAVARRLLDRGFRVRAFTRFPQKSAARQLAGLGAEIAQGDLNDSASVQLALKDVYGVFSVQNFWEVGYDQEVRQGTTLADLAKAAGVQHFVYSSVGGADRDTGLPHFDSKWRIEEHIRQIGLPHSILRPVFFMDNWANYARDQILSGTLPQPLDPDTPLQQIAVSDIGVFASLAFENPEAWLARAVEIAGDELTMPQVAQIFTRVLARPVTYVEVRWDQFLAMAGEEMTRMYQWFNDLGYKANIPALRQEYPPLQTLERFLRTQTWIPTHIHVGS